jgi:P pilus assembly chaperone PapD
MNSATTLQNQKEQQIFLGFRILRQKQKETTNKEKSFWIFLKYQTENRR